MIQALALALLLLTQDVQSVPEEFVTRYRAREQSIETGMVQSTWEDFQMGQPTRRDRQTLYQDTLGRRRLQMQSEQPQKDGTWIPHEQFPYESTLLFDGSLTASMTFDPRVDRAGMPPKAGTNAAGYRSVSISNGDEHVVRNHRVPIAFADGIITVLESALRNKIPIEVTTQAEEQVAFRFAGDKFFAYDKDGDFWNFEIDKTRDWVPTTIVRLDQSGKVFMRNDFEYATTSSGFWYPKKGSLRLYGAPGMETPYYESRFEVSECQINDPEFDEDIFRIVLYPDTAVFDARYGVNYRIGTENTYTTQLAALAQAALDVNKADPHGLGTPVPMTPSPDELGRRILVWVNVALVAVVVAVLVGRRRMAK